MSARARAGIVAAGALAVLAVTPGTARAQDLSGIVPGPDGWTAFHYDIDPEVRVCENSIGRGSDGTRWMWGRTGDDGGCEFGRVEVRARVRDGRIDEIDVGPVGAERVDRDLGEVAAQRAAEWLVEVPWRTRDDDAAGRAWMAIHLADDVNVDARMAAGVRDRGLPNAIRRQVLFWAGQTVTSRLGDALAEVVRAEAEDQELRDQAIFALSQRPAEESIPLLMDLARTAPHVRSRETALFWLAQNDTPEVGEFFAEMILRPGGY